MTGQVGSAVSHGTQPASYSRHIRRSQSFAVSPGFSRCVAPTKRSVFDWRSSSCGSPQSSAVPGAQLSVAAVAVQPAGYRIEKPFRGDVNDCVSGGAEGSGVAEAGWNRTVVRTALKSFAGSCCDL